MDPKKDIKRCGWVDMSNPLYIEYHDKEWGVPVHSNQKLFEMLILEGAQAGLSWATILKKRQNYQKAFDRFDYKKIAGYDGEKINMLLKNEGIIIGLGGVYGNVLRLQPPLCINEEQASQVLNKISQGMNIL